MWHNCIIDLANPKAKVNAIDAADWGGSAFLTDDWPLSIEKAEKMLNFRTNLSRDEAIANLSGALKISVDKVRCPTLILTMPTSRCFIPIHRVSIVIR